MSANKIMPHPLHLLCSGSGSTYWYFRKYLARVSIDDIYTIMLCNLKANFCFAHPRRTSYYDKRIHKKKCFVLTLTDNAALRLFEELNNILYLLGHRQFGLNFLYTLFNESMREYDTVCLTDIVNCLV